MADTSFVAKAYKFFGKAKNGGTLTGFKAEWDALSDQDKLDIGTGIEDGTLTY